MPKFKKIILFFLVSLLVLPPFFSGGRNIFVQEISSILIYLILAVFLFLPEENKLDTRDKKIYILLLLFLLFTLISSLFSVSPYRSLALWVKYLNYAILFYVVSNVIFKKEEIDFLMKSFLVAGGILCLIGLFFYLTGNYIRVTSTFYWSNPFAGYLLFVLPLAFYYFFKEERNILSISLLAIIILSFILTGSRGAILSFFISFFIFIKYYFINFKKKLPQLISATIVILLIIYIFSLIKSDDFSYLDRNIKGVQLDYSTKIKLNYWEGAIKIFKSCPILGTGLDTFHIAYPYFQKDPISAGKYPHNFILELLSETGILATLFFISFLVYNFIKLKEIRSNEIKLALFFGVIASIIHNIIDIDWHFGANAIIFWAFLGLIYNDSVGKKFEIRNDKKRNFFFLAILFVLSLLLIFQSLILLYSKYNFQLGVSYLNKGELLKAEKYSKRSASLDLNPDYLRQNGIILYSLGAKEGDEDYLNRAEQIYKKLIKIDNHNSLNYELGGKIYAAKENTDQAKIAFKKAISLDKLNHPSFYYDLAVILIKEGELKEAKKILDSITFFYSDEIVENKKMIILANQVETSGIEKDISNIYYLLGFIKEQEERYEDAKMYYEHSLKIFSNNILSKRGLEKLGNLKYE